MTIPREPYPRRVNDVVQPMRYHAACLQAVREFAAERPWKGDRETRRAKFEQLHEKLCRVYSKRTRLEFGDSWKPGAGVGTSGSSFYVVPMTRGGDVIRLRGRMSVVTYLHEFAHALGKGETGAARWSINLFRIIFPSRFAKCRGERHMVISLANAAAGITGNDTRIAQTEALRLGPIGPGDCDDDPDDTVFPPMIPIN